ncbi:MAG TPA: rhodanese-like domain-containing protein, partial [Chloroflexi bacterium]|nr:rhodanese-like domain-containing protein [Chloroflexota bacterium]
MRLKKGLLVSIVLLLLASLALSACGGPQTVEELIEEPEAAVEEAPAEEAAAEQPEAAAEEPEAAEEATEEVAEVEEVGEADLDTAFTAFLGNMVAYNTISPEALNEALAEEDIFLLDVRQPEELEENGYIEGAINIPLRELGENLDKLPSFDTSIVVYCGSGWRATIAMTALGALGWTDVRSLVG